MEMIVSRSPNDVQLRLEVKEGLLCTDLLSLPPCVSSDGQEGLTLPWNCENISRSLCQFVNVEICIILSGSMPSFMYSKPVHVRQTAQIKERVIYKK